MDTICLTIRARWDIQRQNYDLHTCHLLSHCCSFQIAPFNVSGDHHHGVRTVEDKRGEMRRNGNGDHLRTGRGRKGENWEAVTITPSLQFRFCNLEFLFGLSLSYVLVSWKRCDVGVLICLCHLHWDRDVDLEKKRSSLGTRGRSASEAFSEWSLSDLFLAAKL